MKPSVSERTYFQSENTTTAISNRVGGNGTPESDVSSTKNLGPTVKEKEAAERAAKGSRIKFEKLQSRLSRLVGKKEAAAEYTNRSVEKFFKSVCSFHPNVCMNPKVEGRLNEGIKTSGEESYREYGVNLEVMRYFLKQVPKKNIELRTALISRAVNYLQEFAPYDRPETWNWKSNPIQKSQTHYYARERSGLLTAYQNEIAKKLGVSPENIIAVTDTNALNVIRGDFPIYDDSALTPGDKSASGRSDSSVNSGRSRIRFLCCPVFSFPKTTVKVDPPSEKPDIKGKAKVDEVVSVGDQLLPSIDIDIDIDFDDLLAKIKEHPGEPLLIDVSETFAKLMAEADKKSEDIDAKLRSFQKSMRETIEATVRKSLASDSGEAGKAGEDPIAVRARKFITMMDDIEKNVAMGAMVHVSGGEVMYTSLLTDRDREKSLVEQMQEKYSDLDVKTVANSVIEQAKNNWNKVVGAEIDPTFNASNLPRIKVLRPSATTDTKDKAKSDGVVSVGNQSLSDIDELLEMIKQYPDEPLFLDVSETISKRAPKAGDQPEAIGEMLRDLQKSMRETIQAALRKSLASDSGEPAQVDDNPDAITVEGGDEMAGKRRFKEKMGKIERNVIMGGMVQVGGQPILYTSLLTDPDEEESLTQHMQETYPELFGEGSYPDVKNIFANSVIRSGSTPIPHQVVENWSKAVGGNIAPILDALKLPDPGVQFPDAKGIALPKVSNIDTFLKHPTVQAFAGLSRPGSPPYLQILPKTTIKLLRELKDTNFEKTFKKNGLEPMLRFIYDRMLDAMENAVDAMDNKDNFIQFNNNVHIIHEELATLLTIASPYTKESFKAEMQKVSDFLPDGFPAGIKPDFHLKNSAMRCTQSILLACGAQKKSSEKSTGELNIMSQSAIYYEMGHMLKQRKSGQFKGKFDGNDGIDEEVDIITKSVIPEDERTDVFLADFHHNSSQEIGEEGYKPQNLIAQVDELYKSGRVSGKFTVAIDHTIGLTDADELKGFLEHNAARIAEGKLNVVIYRSTQKFDQLGMDNYHGGIMAVVNDGSFDAFNKSVSDEADQMSNAALQGITHLERAVQGELNEYRSAIMNAVQGFMTPGGPIGFPDEMIAREDSSAILQLIPSTDPQSTFVHFVLPPDCEIGDVQILKHLEKMSREDPVNFPIMVLRDSFGYNQANVLMFGGEGKSGFRFTPGLEGDAVLKNYRDFFVAWNDVLTEATQGKADLERAEAINTVLEKGSELVKLKLDIAQGKLSEDDIVTAFRLQQVYGEVDDQERQEHYGEKMMGMLKSTPGAEQKLLEAGLITGDQVPDIVAMQAEFENDGDDDGDDDDDNDKITVAIHA
jgi:hypothetical protein